MPVDYRAHYVAVLRCKGIEIDRGPEVEDIDALFDNLPAAVDSTREMLFGFDPEDVRTWCLVELDLRLWRRDGDQREILLEMPFWSSNDVPGNIAAVDRIRRTLPDIMPGREHLDRLVSYQDAAARLLAPYLRVVGDV